MKSSALIEQCPLLIQMLSDANGAPMQLTFDTLSDGASLPPLVEIPAPRPPDIKAHVEKPARFSVLNAQGDPKYDFNNFVVGPVDCEGYHWGITRKALGV